MLKIRMQRIGKINQPAFRIVVVEHTESPKTGNFVDKVGTYNPKTKERKLDAERIKYWLSKGAQASDSVWNIFLQMKLVDGDKRKVVPTPKPKVVEEVKAPEAKAPEAKAEEKKEEKKEEVKEEPKAPEAKAEEKKEEVKEEPKVEETPAA